MQLLRLPQSVLIPFAVLAVGLVGYVDYITGVEVRVFPLYFLPIAWVAATSRRRWSAAIAVLCTAVWLGSNELSGEVKWSPTVYGVNALTMSAAFVTIALLVSELRRRLHLERDRSRTDALTGLSNRHAFHELGSLLIAVARRSKRPLTFAYVDLDNFKAINDTMGHHEGDQALIETAKALRGACRAGDLVARLGGDEFALLLPDTGGDAARTSLERLRERIATLMQERRWPATISVGVVTYDAAPDTIDEALGVADAAMYRAKSAGKNQVVVEASGRQGL